jgi:hypothetical protein
MCIVKNVSTKEVSMNAWEVFNEAIKNNEGFDIARYKFELNCKAVLGAKINTIARELGGVSKDGTNSFQKFDFVSHEHMTNALKPLLERNKVSLIPEVCEVTERDWVVTDKGGATKNWTRTVVQGFLRIIDDETGHEIRVASAGADQDTTGKSYGQAVTEMVKRAEFKLFHVTDKASIDLDSKNSTIEGMDPLTWIKQHEDLRKICSEKKLTRPQIIEAVESGAFDHVKVKSHLMSI